jgi:hypothetical protein
MTRGLDSRIKVEPPFYDSSLFLFLLFSFILLYCGCVPEELDMLHMQTYNCAREVSITR